MAWTDRMNLYREDANLFLDVAPAFVASLPPAPPRDEAPESLKEPPLEDIWMLARNNSNVKLRFEIEELLVTFTKEHANQNLSFDDYKQVAEALEDILYLFEDLVDNSIISNDTIQMTGKFRKLESLRQYLTTFNIPSLLNERSQASNEVRRWISYFEPGRNRTEAVQYRAIARSAKQFNFTMGKIFQYTTANVESRPTQVFQEDRDEAKISLEDYERDLAEYARLSSAIEATVKVILETSKACHTSHSYFIYLSGFYETKGEVKIETIMTVCESERSERSESSKKWHPVHWVGSIHANELRLLETSTTTICRRLRQIRKAKKKLCIKVCPDGSWEEVRTDHRMEDYTKPPEIVLQDLLIARQDHRDANKVAPSLTKQDRIDLGIKIARSFLCLISSPLLQCRWKSESMFVSRGTDAPHDEDGQTKAYIQNNHLTKAITPGSKKHIMVELGALLWELFFAQKVKILKHDEESDDEDEIPSLSLYNALNREEIASRQKFVEVECLDIIANCLNAYDGVDELDDGELRADIYDKIIKPLKEYLQSYNTSRTNKKAASPSPMPVFRQPLQGSYPLPIANKNPLNQTQSMFASSLSVQKNWLLHTNSKVVGDQLNPALLASNTNITNSSSWLNKFDHACKSLIPFDEGAHSEAIKIAILDTGCDLEDKFFCGPGIDFVDDMMVRWLDCVCGTREPVDEDPHSHGTAMAALLLRLVPRATIYVVRVARDSKGLSAAKEIIAEAIIQVVKKWDVDIISMSFGFGDEVHSIRDAILEAEKVKKSKILFFAAANNDGLNESEMFPAFFESVISVRGTRHDGSFEPLYNPNTRPHKAGVQYGTLAQNVSCSWVDDRLTKSGCSVATPIMAAIAAVIILFVGHRFPLDFRSQSLIRTRRGILRVFRAMADDQNLSVERLYLAPWQLFENNRNPAYLIGDSLSRLP